MKLHLRSMRLAGMFYIPHAPGFDGRIRAEVTRQRQGPRHRAGNKARTSEREVKKAAGAARERCSRGEGSLRLLGTQKGHLLTLLS